MRKEKREKVSLGTKPVTISRIPSDCLACSKTRLKLITRSDVEKVRRHSPHSVSSHYRKHPRRGHVEAELKGAHEGYEL